MRLHHFVVGSSGPGYWLLCFNFQVKKIASKGREIEKCQGVHSSSDDSMRMIYRCSFYTAYVDSKVGGSGCPI